MAMLDSVTVSIAAEARGTVRSIFFVIFVFKIVSEGRTEDSEGSSNTSSKVIASRTFMSTSCFR